MKLLPRIFLSILLPITIWSCERDTESYSDDSRDYYPVALGKYIIYDVDSVIWDDFSKTMTVRKSEMKYEYTDTFTDGAGRLTYVVTISRKDSGSTAYVEDNVATVTLNDCNAEFYQKNLKFIPMVFPVNEGEEWDGLAFIDRKSEANILFSSLEWQYGYNNVGKPFTAGSKKFDRTVTVDHIDMAINDPDADPEYYAERVYSREVYAKGRGMVYKELIYWTYQPLEAFRSGKGVIMTYQVSNFE